MLLSILCAVVVLPALLYADEDPIVQPLTRNECETYYNWARSNTPEGTAYAAAQQKSFFAEMKVPMEQRMRTSREALSETPEYDAAEAAKKELAEAQKAVYLAAAKRLLSKYLPGRSFTPYIPEGDSSAVFLNFPGTLLAPELREIFVSGLLIAGPINDDFVAVFFFPGEKDNWFVRAMLRLEEE